jgi:TP901 family phage tail tape measure protein
MTSFLNIQLTADANFAPVYSELARLKSAMASLSKQTMGNIVPAGLVSGLQSAETQMLANVAATRAFSVETIALASSTERLTKQISQSKLKLGEYFSIIGKSRKGIVDEINQVAAAQAKMHAATIIPSSTQKGYAHIIAATSAAGNAAKQAQIYQQLLNTAYKDGAEKLINFGKNTQWAGRQLTAGLTVPMALAGKAASQMFLDVNTEMTRLQKVYGVGLTEPTKAQLNLVKNEIMGLATEMSKTLGVSAKETTSMAADLAAAGLTGKDLINATKQASRMVVLGETDKQDAIKATIALQTAFKLNTTELTDSVNFFNAAQAATSTNMADLIGAIPRVGPVVKGLGGSYKDMVALLVAMKEGGVSAGEGANALKNSLGRLISPTATAQKSLAAFGIDINGIVNKNSGNMIGMITDLQKGLDNLSSLDRQRAISELFGKFQFARMTALFNNFNKEGTQSAKVMQMMGLSSAQLAGIADKQTKQIQESAAGKYKIAMESFKTAILPIGESFLTVATKVLEVGEKIAHLFSKLGPIGTAIKAVLGGAMLVGPITMVIGLVANLAGQLFKIYNGARMFKQGFGKTEGGLLAKFKGGSSGTQNYFKEVDPSLLASQRLSETVTQQVMKEEDAIKALTMAIAEYASEVTRLEQIYAGGPITPRPIPGGTPGARASAAGSPSIEIQGDRGSSYEGELQFIHSGQGASTAGALFNAGASGRVSGIQSGFYSTNPEEQYLQKAIGKRNAQIMLPESELRGMNEAQLRKKLIDVTGGGVTASGAVNRLSTEQLVSFLSSGRTKSQTAGSSTIISTANAILKSGGSISDINAVAGKTPEEYKTNLEILAKRFGVDVGKITTQMAKATESAEQKAIKDVAHITDPEERLSEFAKALSLRLNELTAKIIHNSEIAIQEAVTHEAIGDTPSKKLSSARDAVTRSKGLGRFANLAAPAFAGGIGDAIPSGLSAEQRSRLVQLRERKAARESGISMKSKYGEWESQLSDYTSLFDEVDSKNPSRRMKISSKLNSVRTAFGKIGQSKFAGIGGAALGMGAGMLSSMMPGSNKPYEEQSMGMQTMGGLSKGLEVGGAIGQFLPPPYNMIATGAGAIVGAVGGLIQGRIAHARMLSRQQAAALEGAAMTSSTALEHFRIKVTDFGNAAFKSAVTTSEAVKSEIDSLSEKYKAQQEQDSHFKDEVEGIKRMGTSEQFKLLKEKFLADMAAGMTATQAKTDVAAYMQNAGITGFGSAGFLSGLQSQMQLMTRQQAMTTGFRNASSGQTGAFAFNVTQTATSAKSLYDSFNEMNTTLSKTKESVVMNSSTFDTYNSKVREQNSALANYNQIALNTAVQTNNLTNGSAGYQQALERLMVANRLFVNGTIQTADQLVNATATQAGLQAFLNVDAVEGMVSKGSNIIDQAVAAANQSAATKSTGSSNAAAAAAAGKKATGYSKQEIQDHIKAQKTLNETLKTQIDENNTLRQQAQAAVEANKEVQGAQNSLDEAMASGNLLRISAAQANLEETRNRISNTKQFDSTQARLEKRQQAATEKADKWTEVMKKYSAAAQKSTTSVAKTTTKAMTGIGNIAVESKGYIDTLAAGLTTWTGSMDGFFRYLSGKGATTPAGKAWKALKDAHVDAEKIKSVLSQIKATPEFKNLADIAQSLALSMKNINSFSQIAGISSAQSRLSAIAKGSVINPAIGQNRATVAQVAASLKSQGQGTTASEIGNSLSTAFGKDISKAKAALGFGKNATIRNFSQLATALGYGKENISDYYLDQDLKTPVDSYLLSFALQGYFDTKTLTDGVNKGKKVINTKKTNQGDYLPKFTDKAHAAFSSNASLAPIFDATNNPFVKDDRQYKPSVTYGSYNGYTPYDKMGNAIKQNGALGIKFLGGNVDDTQWFARGGSVSGPGTGTSDSISARLSHGEYVINASAAKKMGIKYLDMINQGMLLTPTFSSINSGSNGVNVGTMNNTVYNINVNVEGSSASPDDIANAVLKTIERKQQTLYSNRRII